MPSLAASTRVAASLAYPPTAPPLALAPTPPPALAPGRHRPSRLELAAWAARLGRPQAESRRARSMARLGGLAAVLSLLGYLTWRVLATLPPSGPGRVAAWALILFEALPLVGSVIKLHTWWNIDAVAPAPVTQAPGGMRVAVLIPTYNEPLAVVGPTIAAACELEPAHETWVLDDGDRPWLEELCDRLGVRYVTRAEHQHAKAGNMNHALALMGEEECDGAEPVDLIAVLDCDHVPLPTFLTATLGWFEDEKVALVQAPQNYFNDGAFDDDGYTGEQGLFFNIQLPARQHAGAGPFWCGSTSVLRVAALREVGGVAQETLIEDMHTTLKLQRAGWKAVYHHQTVALGLAPSTPDQYLVQRRRWGMGAMQVMVLEKLWRRHRWLTLRAQYEYLTGTLWWLEGLATVVAFLIPITMLLTGAATSTATPVQFAAVFVIAFSVRLWGYKRLMRKQIRWSTAFALRVLRVPVGLSCLWWLVSRRTLQFKVTPKGAADDRARGQVPLVVLSLVLVAVGVLGYAGLGLADLVPWRTDSPSTVSSGLWLVLATGVLLFAVRRIYAERYASSRRAAHRFPVRAPVRVAGQRAELMDVSMGGAAIRFAPRSLVVTGRVVVELPGAAPVLMELTQAPHRDQDAFVATLRVPEDDWETLRELALWLFHTPDGVVPGLPSGTPAAAVLAS